VDGHRDPFQVLLVEAEDPGSLVDEGNKILARMSREEEETRMQGEVLDGETIGEDFKW